MNTRQMDKFTDHCAKFFDQEPMIMHTESHMDMHVDVLLFEPNEKYPFWKLVTMGASDYKMPKTEFSLGDRNEYMMFVDADEDLTDRFVVDWYYQQLMNIALMPYKEKFAVSYGHSMEWELEDGEEMCGCFLEMPQVLEDPSIMRCKLGLFHNVVLLQAILLNKHEIEKLLTVGPEDFSYYLYPDTGRQHYLSQRRRTSKF